MFNASAQLSKKWADLRPSQAAHVNPLTYVDATLIGNLLQEDGCHTSYSALVSIGDAIRGIEAGFYSWATVKLYYAVFYGFRALLAFNKIAVFYANRTCFWVTISPGERPIKGRSSSSHKVVMEIFKKHLNDSMLLSQAIGYSEPTVWLQEQRERVNYTQAKFSEPEVPIIFKGIERTGSIRKSIAAYIYDDIYTFDPDHAILAYPIAVFKEIKRKQNIMELLTENDRTALKTILSDSLGPIVSFNLLIGL